jgi:(R,R)-butanediol dehydrogenase/meso-butanediol dehydrogenase/diacetyl reductase
MHAAVLTGQAQIALEERPEPVAGPGAGGLDPGRPVVVNPIALSCGSCAACRRGLSNQCLAALGACSGVARDGGMAEFVTADQRSIHAVPDGLTLWQAAWTEPLAVAVRAVAHGGVRPGTTVGGSSMWRRSPRACRP